MSSASAAAARRVPLVNIPNLLTFSRLVLAVVLFALIAFELWLACLVVFVVAAVTDWLDGYLARRNGMTSSFGRSFDPLVDKVLVCGAFIFLLPVAEAGFKPWMVTVVVAREFLITGIRGYLEQVGVAFGADWLGKLKMGLQCAVLIGAFLVLGLAGAPADLLWLLRGAYVVLLWLMLLATVLSGAQYLGKAAVLLKAEL
jgi:CDP-diacylglycerol---glycerol-3-phosphate 3-phosphatidyltransferase